MDNNLEIATLAGGCFWCMEALFKRLKGVISVYSGFSGGWKENPDYEIVSTGKSGHAEAIQITYDPAIIPYKTILEVFWKMHDPTTPNRQGPDVGTQYRSVIFYHTRQQKETAQKSKAEIEKSGLYQNKIITEISPFKDFYQAENHHQNYYEKNSYEPYCQIVIDPKIQKLKKEFKGELKTGYSGI